MAAKWLTCCDGIQGGYVGKGGDSSPGARWNGIAQGLFTLHRMAPNLNLMSYFWILQLVFWDCSWPWVSEAMQSKIMDWVRGRNCCRSNSFLLQFPQWGFLYPQSLPLTFTYLASLPFMSQLIHYGLTRVPSFTLFYLLACFIIL